MRPAWRPKSMPLTSTCATSTRRTSLSWSPEWARPHSNCSRSAPDLDVIFVPVGGGSGVLGAGVVARAVNPAIRVIGVQAEGAPAVYRSWREGRRVVTENVATFAEGLATREPFAMPLALFPRLVDEIMLVDDDEIAAAIRLLIETTRQVAEGAGAASVAAAIARRDELAGKRVGLILSGGNITTEQLCRILNHQQP